MVTQALSVLTVTGEAIIVLLVLDLLLNRKSKNYFLADTIGKNAILFSFIIALFTTIGSLFFSEIAGYEPCVLCWYQRIFMYPQVFLLGLALKRKDDSIIPYSMLLSAIGAIIAAYQSVMQIGVVPGLPCPAAEFGVSCSQRFIFTFGHITIPFMSLVAFVMIFLFLKSRKAVK